MGVFGYSMEASTCIMAMERIQCIKAGIFETGFTDFNTIIIEAARRDFGLPYFPMVPMASFFYEWRGAVCQCQAPQTILVSCRLKSTHRYGRRIKKQLKRGFRDSLTNTYFKNPCFSRYFSHSG